MSKIPSILVFDVGKTNKKIILFDAHYRQLYEENVKLPGTVDEDGFPCEDIGLLSKWIARSTDNLLHHTAYQVRAVNFSAYGASWVHLDEQFQPLTPFCNYLKPYPAALSEKFYDHYGGRTLLSRQTASPALGSLNSGLQLYRLKYEQPDIFRKIRYSLHLPQYLSFLLSSLPATEITSVGCHTHLWDFGQNDYHRWVDEENIRHLFAAMHDCDRPVGKLGDGQPIGIGLHDSSAALVPYLSMFREPFVLLSTGTWSISLNPFNTHPLTDRELGQDCLCYLSFEGKPVKASRLFLGREHEQGVHRLAMHFEAPPDYYRGLSYDAAFSGQPGNDPLSYPGYGQAYHQLMLELVEKQVRSAKLVLDNTAARNIYVDGGFSRNNIFMQMLANAFPGMEVYAASMPHASALGAALSIHTYWNAQPISGNIISLKKFAPA